MGKTEQHTVYSPPDALVREWQRDSNHNEPMFPQVAAKAAQWGADQELEACCKWLEGQLCMPENSRAYVISKLCAARRPKPPSLKKQALEQLRVLDQYGALDCNTDKIRKALEALPND
jgi:hypothetical protein